MEKITHCPVCGKNNFKEFLKGKDYFLTGQDYTIEECIECGFKITNPRPDEVEILSYYESPEYIAHDTGKGTFLETVYKFVREFTLRNKYKTVKKYSSGNDLLDIGCGTGEFLNYCKKMGYNTYGIEPNQKARQFAIDNFGLTVSDETQLDHFSMKRFNVITLWHVLEHVHQLSDRIQKIRQLLRPEGTMIIAVPNCDSWDAKRYYNYWAAYDLPRHLYHFTKNTMRGIVEKNGFNINNIIPLKFDAFYISLLSQKYKSGKHSYIKALANGFRSNHFARYHENNYSSLIYICKIAKDSK